MHMLRRDKASCELSKIQQPAGETAPQSLPRLPQPGAENKERRRRMSTQSDDRLLTAGEVA